MKIGSIIERIRNDHGWSQDELADKCGTTKSNISRIEKNKQWPREDLLEKICDTLGLKLYQLFALAENVDLPVLIPEYNKDEHELINAWRCMDNDLRDQYLVLAKSITNITKKGG